MLSKLCIQHNNVYIFATFELKFNGIIYVTAFVQSKIFWPKVAKFCCHKKHQNLSAQKPFCFDTKNVGKIDLKKDNQEKTEKS